MWKMVGVRWGNNFKSQVIRDNVVLWKNSKFEVRSLQLGATCQGGSSGSKVVGRMGQVGDVGGEVSSFGFHVFGRRG